MFFSDCGANNYPLITKNNYLEPIIISIFVIPRNLYRYKLGKIIMIGICISINYGK